MDGPNTPLKLSGVHGIYYALSDNAMIRRVPSLIFHQEEQGISLGVTHTRRVSSRGVLLNTTA
ncbi:uncharacterized protein METZ01_LOCUS163274 [marine metagenome]|uniref:Uncharacterized protein n=1 Tax=marine metagenome TaxID=408172 RepID=A0A382B9D9_9ZZZZ